MKFLPVSLIIFWIIIIVFPAILVFLIGGFFIFIWINMLAFFSLFKKKKDPKWDNYVKFGKYKIYR
jgi:hypothetical protein